MNRDSYQAFGDELVKIAFFNRLAKGFKDAVRVGWHGLPNDKNRWLGQKGLTAAGTAAMVPTVTSNDDPMRMGRGKVERAVDLAGSTVGGLAASGVMARRFPQLTGAKGLAMNIGAGLVGGIGGGRLLASPFELARKRREGKPIAPMTPAGKIGFGISHGLNPEGAA
jgi:uncharacterized membrane protein YeaQ/YmgE (transglycosylase-associated protein family)